jgi:hypothetical protein
MASSVVPALYALQGGEAHGVVSIDCKAKAPENLELSYQVDEVVTYSPWVISCGGLERFECSSYLFTRCVYRHHCNGKEFIDSPRSC